MTAFAYAHLARMPAGLHAFAAAPTSLRRRLRAKLDEHRAYRAALGELEQLSQRELDELNVASADLPAIARAESLRRVRGIR